jgi:hypothetical protein
MNAGSCVLRLASVMAARLYAGLKGTFALFGLVAVAAFVFLPHPRETLIQSVAALDGVKLDAGLPAEDSIISTGRIKTGAVDRAEQLEQRALVEFIARRYRVAEQALSDFVGVAYHAGKELDVEPVLILAVMAIESRFNPVAQSSMGAKGLMQVIPRFHLEKLLEHGGEQALLDPYVNIYVGTQILREYMRRFGDVETALQKYVGALDDPNSGYANKVFAERARLEVPLQQARRQPPAVQTSASLNAPGNGSG